VKLMSILLAVSLVPAALSAQYWDGPYQLTSSLSDDINPSACKEFLPGNMTCLVWQSLGPEVWNIHSRFGNLYNGNGWEDEQWVTFDSAVDNVNPAVACLNDWQDHPSYWCVWEHRVSQLGGSIRASFITSGDSWGLPVELGPSIHTDADSAMPGVITISGTSADTVWVAWRNHDTSGTYIRCAYYAGDSWSSPEIAVAADLKHARLGRAIVQDHAKPMLVWERSGDIWYTVRDSSGWRTPAQVAPSAYEDRDPDIVSDGGYWGLGTYVVWQSTRDGDTAVYVTEPDSFSVGQRACNDTGAGSNFSPAGADFAATTRDYWGCFIAWVSDRNGNPDVYTSCWGPWDYWVDLDPADDLAPVVTSMGSGMGAQMAWVLWQSNRNGNWDILGSFAYSARMTRAARLVPRAGRMRSTAAPSAGACFPISRRITSARQTKLPLFQ